VLQAASDALIRAARAKDPSLQPADTRSVMGAVPRVLRHHTTPRAHHRHVRTTRSLRLFSHAVPTKGSTGLGTHRPHGGSYPAPFRVRDGVYVQPRLPEPTTPTIGMVALRSALQKIGLPYVWAAAGPSTFDCSGLVQWAYAHAGIRLIHFTGSQYQEGRLLKPKQILPGDLILFDHLVGHHHDIHHVGIYLGAGWMVNAPYTGQYVNVVPVPGSIAGIVRP
jgi:cell wall-associated NlpC family hydrolase